MLKTPIFSQLVRAGVLTARQERSWWLAIPNVGEVTLLKSPFTVVSGIYMKALLRGRKATSTVIRKCKYREILKSVLTVFTKTQQLMYLPVINVIANDATL